MCISDWSSDVCSSDLFATCGPSSRFSAGLGRRFGGGLATCGPSSRFSAGLGRRFGGGLATCGPSSRFLAGLGRRFDGVVLGQVDRGVGAGPPWAIGPWGGEGRHGGAGGAGVLSALTLEVDSGREAEPDKPRGGEKV